MTFLNSDKKAFLHCEILNIKDNLLKTNFSFNFNMIFDIFNLEKTGNRYKLFKFYFFIKIIFI